jgi:hypothetical protein
VPHYPATGLGLIESKRGVEGRRPSWTEPDKQASCSAKPSNLTPADECMSFDIAAAAENDVAILQSMAR